MTLPCLCQVVRQKDNLSCSTWMWSGRLSQDTKCCDHQCCWAFQLYHWLDYSCNTTTQEVIWCNLARWFVNPILVVYHRVNAIPPMCKSLVYALFYPWFPKLWRFTVELDIASVKSQATGDLDIAHCSLQCAFQIWLWTLISFMGVYSEKFDPPSFTPGAICVQSFARACVLYWTNAFHPIDPIYTQILLGRKEYTITVQ